PRGGVVVAGIPKRLQEHRDRGLARPRGFERSGDGHHSLPQEQAGVLPRQLRQLRGYACRALAGAGAAVRGAAREDVRKRHVQWQPSSYGQVSVTLSDFACGCVHSKHMQEFLDKFRYNARRAALVQSRIKAIERMEQEAVEEVVE